MAGVPGTPGLPGPGVAVGPYGPDELDGSTAKVKLATVLDQTCDSEVKMLGVAELRALLTAWKRAHNDGEEPTEEEEATGEQITALAHRLRQGGTPYVDFGVWRSHGSDLGRVLKFAAYFRNAQGQFTAKEIVGPTTFSDWERSWRVFAFAMELLGAASRTRLEKYRLTIAALNRDYPTMWWLTALADIKMRRTHIERIRRRLLDEHTELTGVGLRSEYDPSLPWDSCFREAARDREFWMQEVEKKVIQFTTHQRSRTELVDPGFGSLTFAPPVGGGPAGAAPGATGEPRKKRKTHGERRAAAAANAVAGAGDAAPKGGKGKAPKGGGKGKSKDINAQKGGRFKYDHNGVQICWNWNNSRTGCSEPCPQGRRHICEICRDSQPPASHRTCEHA